MTDRDALFAEAEKVAEILREIVPPDAKATVWWMDLLTKELPQREPAIRAAEAYALSFAANVIRDLVALLKPVSPRIEGHDLTCRKAVKKRGGYVLVSANPCTCDAAAASVSPKDEKQ